METIYSPSEDSFLLSEVLEKNLPKMLSKNPNLFLLEVGSGSGINLETALKSDVKKENIFSCDINVSAVKQCKISGFNCIKSDLFEKIRGKYDVIIFNPPYLPRDSREPKSSRLSTTGGKNGSEIINRFLKDAKKFLKKNGKIFFVSSIMTKGINFEGYKKKKIAEKKLFFEKLFVWELKI
ncbi:methyltransferase [Candidatus Pacearchaeota archaeon]|nr:methyltransferase [Candidatus Pacearchaeota archaeon]